MFNLHIDMPSSFRILVKVISWVFSLLLCVFSYLDQEVSSILAILDHEDNVDMACGITSMHRWFLLPLFGNIILG